VSANIHHLDLRGLCEAAARRGFLQLWNPELSR